MENHEEQLLEKKLAPILQQIQFQLDGIQQQLSQISASILPSKSDQITLPPTELTEENKTKNIEPDYTNLEQLLAVKNWLEADQETAKILLFALAREKRGYLQDSEIYKLPCSVLQTIDRLWVTASEGKFGLTIQKQIYQNLGGNRFLNLEIWRKFGQEVGWYLDANWLDYNQLNFSGLAPKGHLPVMGDGRIWFVSNWEGSFTNFSTFLFRVIECKLNINIQDTNKAKKP
jgi:hypothetical protein